MRVIIRNTLIIVTWAGFLASLVLLCFNEWQMAATVAEIAILAVLIAVDVYK